MKEVVLTKKFHKFHTVKVRFGSAEQFGKFSAEQFGSAELEIKKFGSGSVRPNFIFGPQSSVRHENLWFGSPLLYFQDYSKYTKAILVSKNQIIKAEIMM